MYQEKENEALQLRMNASQERNALEQEKLIAALQTSKETSNKEDLASTKELLKNLESQKSEMQAQIEALEKDINSKVFINILIETTVSWIFCCLMFETSVI